MLGNITEMETGVQGWLQQLLRNKGLGVSSPTELKGMDPNPRPGEVRNVRKTSIQELQTLVCLLRNCYFGCFL